MWANQCTGLASQTARPGGRSRLNGSWTYRTPGAWASIRPAQVVPERGEPVTRIGRGLAGPSPEIWPSPVTPVLDRVVPSASKDLPLSTDAGHGRRRSGQYPV